MQEETESPCEFQDLLVAPGAKVVDLKAFRERQGVEARVQMLERENRYLNSIYTNLIITIEGLRQRSRSR